MRIGVSLGCVCALVLPAFAGPITPPPGPVASTHKTLTEVEPRIAINETNTPGDADSLYKISAPGSYYLTGNITGVSGKHGIEIAASGVTLDLNGFDLVGVAGMGAFDGVTTSVAELVAIEIRNGSIRNWGDEGIDLGSQNTRNCIVACVRAIGNSGNGVLVGEGSLIEQSVSAVNGNGFLMGNYSVISRSSAVDNLGFGISFDTGTASTCLAHNNGSFGLSAGSDSVVTACGSSDNGGDGFRLSFGSVLSSSTARLNGGHGVSATSGSHVVNCVISRSRTDGVRVGSQCRVDENILDGNGEGGDGAGVHATGADNHIEGNNCFNNDRGIDVDGAGNMILRNTCSGNTTNWDIAANNIYGPIIDRTVPASAAVSGNSASDTSGSSHPNANFTY